MSLYKKQLCISLVDYNGIESKVGSLFKELVVEEGNPNIMFYCWDFHTETKGNNFSTINLFIEQLSHSLSSMQFQGVDQNGNTFRKQTLTVRTNCLDCLDRTNLIQVFFLS